MKASDIVRLADPRRNVSVDVREVVRDFDAIPHVFWRATVSGWQFPQRALLPFLLIGDVVSRFVVIAPDGASAAAYFDAPIPSARRVSFGYGRVVSWDFDVRVSGRVRSLDRLRLPQGVRDPFA